MSYVAPVSAVLLMIWTASAATSVGPTTRPIGSVARSSFLRSSSSVSEQRCRQRGVDEAGGDEVDANRRELKREGRHERRQRGGGGGGDPVAGTDPSATGAAHEQQCPSGPHLAHGVAGDLEAQHQVTAQPLAHLG